MEKRTVTPEEHACGAAFCHPMMLVDSPRTTHVTWHRTGVWKNRPHSSGQGKAAKRKARGWRKGWLKERMRKDKEPKK